MASQLPKKTKQNINKCSLPLPLFSWRHKQRYVVFLVLISFFFFFLTRKDVTNHFYTIVSLFNTKWTLPQTTYLQFMFWVFFFPFFYEDVEFCKIYTFVKEIIFWYKYHHTFYIFLWLKNVKIMNYDEQTLLTFT